MTENRIATKIDHLGEGAVFFPSDFDDLGSADTVRQALSRLVRKGRIIRLCNGVYCTPRKNKLLGLSNITPSTDEIARRIAERDHVKIIPTGDTALNLTGLSTQIPMNAVYLTNGSRKDLTLFDGRRIIFKESNESRRFRFTSQMVMLVVSAMRAIGQTIITSDQVEILKGLLAGVTKEEFDKNIRLAPAWVKSKL
ncbi:MAG: type IV toxin-antitoxin system AbiEi family antitoxin domain-containing protein [Paramuribaculum sp.]|nr:type IV toxin-antitoxin system AbiEi family antitoxin domain-containing protein [Paramuribaculum sp.]